MSKHWPPDDSFRTRSASAPSALPVVIGAVLVGLTAGMMLGWSGRNAGDVGAASGIEWNAVQSVPTRAPDAEDLAWEQRARALDGAGSSGGSAAGNAATQRLHALLNSGAVTMTPIDPDRDRDVYGRLLRNVAVNGEDVGEAMVGAGVARDYAGGRRPWC
jgi:hypothetical protein